MAAKVTFDGPNKLVIIKPGITDVNVQTDMYSDWKEEVISGSGDDLMKFQPVFVESIGNNDLGNGKFLGTFFIFNNTAGWRIKPDESHATVEIVGNLYPLDPATDFLTGSVGSFNTNFILTRSIDALSVVSDPTALADAVLDAQTSDHQEAGSTGKAITDALTTGKFLALK